ncbi:MAG TPA: hypothetical protein VJX73_14830 [Terracidiphilus sp.]|nr:hypothetical protein [Terracidiphilus sp.]
MTVALHLRIVGALLAMLGLSHVFFNRFFGWEQELDTVSLLTRRVFYVHTFFIALGLVLIGAGSLFFASQLLEPNALSRAVLVAMVVFWLCRMLAQWFVYDAAIWRGDSFRTVMHIVFSALWIYVTATYGAALVGVLARP